MRDVFDVLLKPGQRVVYAAAGIHATGELVPGTITKVAVVLRPDGSLVERIGIRRDHGGRCTLGWSKRVLVLHGP